MTLGVTIFYNTEILTRKIDFQSFFTSEMSHKNYAKQLFKSKFQCTEYTFFNKSSSFSQVMFIF